MKFSSIFAFATLALAAPSVDLSKKADTTVVGTALAIVTDAQVAVNTNANAITTAVAQIKDSITAEVLVQIRSLVTVDIDAIIKAITSAATALVNTTIGVSGQIITSVTALAQAEIDNLVVAVNILIDVLVRIQAVVSVTATNLKPATETLLYSELTALLAVVKPFVGPVQVYVDAVTKASASANVALGVLISASAQLQVVVSNTVKTLGVPA